jgi:hypothetical protein
MMKKKTKRRVSAILLSLLLGCGVDETPYSTA